MIDRIRTQYELRKSFPSCPEILPILPDRMSKLLSTFGVLDVLLRIREIYCPPEDRYAVAWHEPRALIAYSNLFAAASITTSLVQSPQKAIILVLVLL
jgi:hypothetical protein